MNSPLNSDDICVVETPAECAKHGPYTSRTFSLIPGGTGPTTGCPVCSEERREAARIRREAAERAEELLRREREIARLLWAAGIPPRFDDKTFGNYAPQCEASSRALRACQRYAETFKEQRREGRSLILAGGPGTGKTHLALAIGQHVIREFQALVLFGTVSNVLRRVKDTYRKTSEETETDVLKALASADLLILDEIGAQTGSEHEKQLMFEILNERYQDMRPTILISNLNTEQLEAFIGHRVMDRYRECGVVLAFGWDSYRGKIKPQRGDKQGGE